jgi:hypothetical protein
VNAQGSRRLPFDVCFPLLFVVVAELDPFPWRDAIGNAHHHMIGRLAVPPANKPGHQLIHVDSEHRAGGHDLIVDAGVVVTFGKFQQIADDELRRNRISVFGEWIAQARRRKLVLLFHCRHIV